MGKSHRGKCNRCQEWVTWAGMLDGKRFPFDETGQFMLVKRGAGDDEKLEAIPLAKRHTCGQAAPSGQGGSARSQEQGPDPDDIL